MALEHLIVASDFQGWGGGSSNVSSIKAFSDFLSESYDPSKTHVHINGDLVDFHPVANGKIFQDPLSEKSQDLLEKSLTDLLEKENISSEEVEKAKTSLYAQYAVKDYIEQAEGAFKSITDNGFTQTAVIGNNEQRVYTMGQVDKSSAKEISSLLRQRISQNTGMTFIDDSKVHDLSGISTFSLPYINDPAFSISGDVETTQDGSEYDQMKKNIDTSVNALFMHGNLQDNDDEAKGIKKYLAEYEGDTLWVFSGHRGKGGVKGVINDKGSKIIYVNSNTGTLDDGRTCQFVYDAEIENGKITAITEYIQVKNS